MLVLLCRQVRFYNRSRGTIIGVPNYVDKSITPNSLNTGQWYHAAATGDGTTARLYLDGVEVGSGAFTGFPTSWERFMRLGSAGAGSGDSGYGTDSLFFDGLIDDARFYDRTLTQTDITHLSSSRGVTGPSYRRPWWRATVAFSHQQQHRHLDCVSGPVGQR